MMQDNEVQTGKNYEYKGHTYTVIDCDDVMVKDSNDSNWYAALSYQRKYDPATENDTSTTIYVRRLDDFCAKFQPA